DGTRPPTTTCLPLCCHRISDHRTKDTAMARFGLIRAGIYAHFKSKADFVAEAITDIAHELASSILAKLICAVTVSRAVDHQIQGHGRNSVTVLRSYRTLATASSDRTIRFRQRPSDDPLFARRR